MKSKGKYILKNQIYEVKELIKISNKLNVTLDKVNFIKSIGSDASLDLSILSENENVIDNLVNYIREQYLLSVFKGNYSIYKSPIHLPENKTLEGEMQDYNYERCLNYPKLEEALHIPHEVFNGFTLAFRSGMSALSSLLTLLIKLYDRKVTCGTAVGYYESVLLLNDYKNIIVNNTIDAKETKEFENHSEYDFYLFEPVKASFNLEKVPTRKIIKKFANNRSGKFQILAFDTSFCGNYFCKEEIFKLLENQKSIIVVFYRSGIKLDQQGMELSNLGIMSVYFSSDLNHMEDKLKDYLTNNRSRMGLTLSLLESEVLNNELIKDGMSYATAILNNTYDFVKNLNIPDHSFIDKIIFPNISQKDEEFMTPYFFLKLSEENEDDYIKLTNIVINESKRHNCSASFRTSFGFRNTSFEYLKNNKPIAEKVFKIAPGKLKGYKYFLMIDIINTVANMTIKEFRNYDLKENLHAFKK